MHYEDLTVIYHRWIAEVALQAPLPAPWREHHDDSGHAYFHNPQTGETVWRHPNDSHFERIVERERLKKIQTKQLRDSQLRYSFDPEGKAETVKLAKTSEGPNRAALVREVMVLLARHIPVRRETPVRP